MNRFRTKKKAKEAPDGVVRASTDSDAPPVVKSSKGFRLGKKVPEPEPKPEIDLSTALPSSDDFRTSLLMSGLSARFSMLREQDDPKSKIGKASDDSVLFPKRHSRLNDFGFSTQGLSDIAEVSSINGSIRPPFAFDRSDSFAGSEGYGTDDDSTHGSIMNRAKPGEGNNLFGGRQKIMMGNRALYDNDVSQSAFQKIREREREQKELDRQREEDAQSSRPSSPPLSGYNRNRETSSTTSSGGPSITRSSTAATSFTSQRTPSLNGGHTPVTPNVPGATGALERSGTKTRRLYETGLDSHLQEQQFSAMSRIDTLTRQRTLGANTPPPGGLSPTYGPTPGDRWDRPIAGKQSMPNLRATSPPPTGTAMGTFDFGVRKNSNAASKPFGMASPPLSPPMSEYDEHGILPMQPNDRGKATALGAFAKPAPYDENKYSQRQVQMQQDREAPPARKNSPPRAFVPRNQQQQQQSSSRNRAESNATYASDRSRSNSSAQRPNDRTTEAPMSNITVPETQAMSFGTFLASPDSASASPNDLAPEQNKFKNHPKPLDLSHIFRPDHRVQVDRPDESQHPAHRLQPDLSPAVASPGLSNMNLHPTSAKTPLPPADSPTLGPGLGSIRQHLRSDSNTSSIYGGVPSAHFASRFPADAHDSMPQNEYTSKSTPWDNDWDQESNYGDDSSANLMNGGNPQPPPLSVRSPNIDTSAKEARNASWEREMASRHIREGSTETQKEHQAFQEELAARRRKVQEKMKSMVESDNRSTSPLPPHPADWPKDAHQVKNNALGLLKTKTSRGSLVGRPKEGPPSKAMKMLGIGNATITSGTPSPGKSRFEDSPWNQDEDEREPVRAPDSTPQTRAFREARRAAQREQERELANRHQQRLGSESEQEWPVQRKERERPRLANQRMDNSWVDNSRDKSRVDNHRMDPRMDNRMDGRMNNRMESPLRENFYRSQDQSERIPPHMRPRHRTPSRERKPPPVTYAHRNGSSSQESKESNGTNRSGSRPPSNASRDRSGSDTSGGRSKSRTGAYRDDLAKAMAEGTSSTSQVYEERPTRLMPRSPGPPGMGLPASPSPIPSPMMGSNRSRSNSKSTPAGYFEKSPNLQTGNEGFEIGAPPRPSPTAPFVVNPTPALIQPSPAGSGTNTPTGQGTPLPGGPSVRKKSINKSDISEPRFISSTSRITTVNLPPGSSLHNGEINAPPIPPVNPKRRQTRTMFGGFMGRRDDDEIHSMPAATQSTEEMSTFSADEGDSKPKLRQKLRKSSSEGGNLNARARQAANAEPSPAMPGTFPAGSGSPPRPIEGGMF